ncbi:hypothetical protein AAZX31_09G197400 [Glycine max]|uniref:Uncharacterized protein n=2 Tax=Glycine subgen. Soja TaxID=1462606 RepID=K7LFA0_SOYBN|nr:hypothetical protein JHK85_026435 [Glycine max]KHN11809.1 hypothetical protein glysoja_006262 [Glycine soja]KAG5013692.1 hypothetical protein JHK86_025953 [Glycine max]KAG5134631.1 hypothetical protein JHK82_025819 [Glycine max]KAH1044144.1 hypothetical protein GYH30_025770 [Glycine max]
MRGWTPHSTTKQQRWWDSTTSPTPTTTTTPPSSLAQDAVVLEQVSAINFSGFTDESLLPSHLETVSATSNSSLPPKPKLSLFLPQTTKVPILIHPNTTQMKNPSKGLFQVPIFHHPNITQMKSPTMGLFLFLFLRPLLVLPLRLPLPLMKVPCLPFSNRRKRNKVPNGTLSLRSSNSPSPPRRKDCLWFSPKKKSKENWGDDHLLSELGSFSRKEQQKMPKKAMKEEEKVSREAEKIVQWAKQESARFNLGDQLSD